MKYIYSIIVIVIVFSIFIGYELFSGKPEKGNPVLIINDKVISANEFNQLYATRADRLSKSDFISSLITKNLLIQEARKEGIDKEKSFKKSIQDFYEQSLIKILIDGKFSSLKANVTDDEVNKYTQLLNKTVHLTIFSLDDVNKAGDINKKGGNKRIVPFQDLSMDVQYYILSIGEGDRTKPINIGDNKYVIYKVDKIEDGPAPCISDVIRDRIRERLIEEKKGIQQSKWIADIRRKARIQIFDK